MTAAVEQLLQSPRLPAFVEELQRVLAEERARRERFYEEINEDTKADVMRRFACRPKAEQRLKCSHR